MVMYFVQALLVFFHMQGTISVRHYKCAARNGKSVRSAFFFFFFLVCLFFDRSSSLPAADVASVILSRTFYEILKLLSGTIVKFRFVSLHCQTSNVEM